jgi:hypothetical protein
VTTSRSKPILALDLATKTGWADSDGESGVVDFSVRRGESAGMRFRKFRSWLCRMLDDGPGYGLVAYEQAHHRGGAPTEVGVGLVTRVQEECAVRDVDYTSYNTTAIKKHALGKGRGGKQAMVEAAKQRWPNVQIVDDNQADALWLLDLAIQEYGDTEVTQDP